MDLGAPIITIKGIGEKSAAAFNKAGIFTVSDLLHYFPRTYSMVPEIRPISGMTMGGRAVVKGRIMGGCSLFSSKGKTVLSFDVGDGTGKLKVYYFGMPYMKKNFPPGRMLLLLGNVSLKGDVAVMAQPRVLSEEEYENTKGTLIPVYPETAGLKSSAVLKAVKEIICISDNLKDYLPDPVINKEGLVTLSKAFRDIHFPATKDDLYEARKRLAFDELFLFIARIQMLKSNTEKEENSFRIEQRMADETVNGFISKLPYELTGAQLKAVNDIKNDMTGDGVANRLVQGDVGCGKTVVAFAAALMAVSAGYQAAIMAPTEVLAMQHYNEIIELTEKYGLPFRTGVLTGSVGKTDKRRCKELLADGSLNLVIGTHALLEEDVLFNELALVVTDEQHRFGVAQRRTLSKKGGTPHTVVMSATPIPRTLGLILYGDMDVSLIDELPAKRLDRKNAVVDTDYRETFYKFLVKHIREDNVQAYIICPMVEASESEELGMTGDIANVTDYTEYLKDKLPGDIRIAMLHGRMKPAEKNEIMKDFSEHKTDVLVSTTVVEVGVNVPNATIMLVENAERFGLSQLHQLRGRVGRGDKQAYCVFMTGTNGEMSKNTLKRLNILKESNDGFKIAEEDLKQRGPGDFFGLRQSGLPYFKIADIYTDAEMIGRVKSVLQDMTEDGQEGLKALETALRESGSISYSEFHSIYL